MGQQNRLTVTIHGVYIRHLFVQYPAEVVELVDALRSGRSGSNPVGVRIPPSAYRVVGADV